MSASAKSCGAGKTAAAAVQQGFAHAWITIVDTHVTTIVSAAILFLFGTGPVKGFAVTLTFGLLANLFTAVFVSRLIFDCILRRRSAARRFRFREQAAVAQFEQDALQGSAAEGLEANVELFRNANVDWLGKKWYFLGFSLIFSVAGVLSMLFWHGIPLGVDFKGGTQITVRFDRHAE